MTFLEPLLLFGLLGAAVPLLIHLFGRPRPRVLRFPMVALLERAQANPSRRLRLRERLLLAARIAVAALLALVLARPAIWAAGGPGAGASRVAVVVDDSFSMGLREGTSPIFDAAKAKARAAVETVLDGGGEAALFLGARGSQDPAPDLTRDRGRLTAALAALRTSARATDLEAAVTRARAALRGEGRVLVVTDGTAPVSAGDDVEIVDVGGDATPANVAVTRVGTEPDLSEAAGTVRVDAEVANFAGEARTVTLALRSGDRTLTRVTVSVPPGKRQSKRLSVRPPPGSREAQLIVDADDLPIDDVRHFVMSGASEIRALIVNGDPRQARILDELFYVRAALEAPGEPVVRARAALPEDLGERLADQDVLVLCNVRALPAPAANALGEFVRKGGGLLVSLGNRSDVDHPVVAPEILGASLASVWSAGSRGPDESPDRLARLGEVNTSHPALEPLRSRPRSLRSARFWGRVMLRPGGSDRRVLLRFEDSAPALVENAVGRGKVLVFASTLDRDWNDLVIRPAFAPLLRRFVQHLGQRSRVLQSSHARIGEACALPAGREGRVVRPDGREERFSGEYRDTDVPGVYRLRSEDGTEVACAVNVDTRESDLRRVSLPEATARADSTPARRAHPVAHAFAAVLLGFLLAESLLARRR